MVSIKECSSSSLYLNDDIVLNILSRLPEKSLMRFKCVSKTWLDLICYQTKQLPTMSGLFYSNKYSLDDKFGYVSQSKASEDGCDVDMDTTLSFLPCHPNTRIISCCNGLLLCKSTTSQVVYYVCNPATRRWAKLPDQINSEGVVDLYDLSLAFDPPVSPNYYVVGFRYYPYSGVTKQCIFCSAAKDEWEECTLPLYPYSSGKEFRSPHHPLIHLEGALYWISMERGIIRLDLLTRSYSQVKMPSHDSCELLGQSRGHINYMSLNCGRLEIWVLKDWDTRQWVMKNTCCNLYSLAKQQRIHHSNKTSFDLELKAFHPYLDVVFLGKGKKLLAYDHTKETLQLVCRAKSENSLSLVFPFSPCQLDYLGE